MPPRVALQRSVYLQPLIGQGCHVFMLPGVFCLWQQPPFCRHCRKSLYTITVTLGQSLQPGCCPYLARLRVAGAAGPVSILFTHGDCTWPFAAGGTCKIALNPSDILLQAPRPHSLRLAATLCSNF